MKVWSQDEAQGKGNYADEQLFSQIQGKWRACYLLKDMVLKNYVKLTALG